MLHIDTIAAHTLQTAPYKWAAIDNLFSAADAQALAASFPHDHFKTLRDPGGEKVFEYDARSLVHMGATEVSFPDSLSPAWRTLAQELCSTPYRTAMSKLVGIDLMQSPLEVNIFHYGAGDSLGPHRDLETKIVTHVLYFNPTWDANDGGYLTILGSADHEDVVARIMPIIGNSAVIVRSEHSWHEVRRVVDTCQWSRRSLTVVFYQPGSPSTMWLPNDTTPLHYIDVADM
jgi:SM-20-related protein